MAARLFSEVLERRSVAKTFCEILKFNPYHDELGRFTTSSFSPGGTYGRNGRHSIKESRDNRNDLKKINIENASMYPETLAGVKTGKEMSFEEADGKRCNPMYGKNKNFDYNCTACVVAYEARRRGYDVSAKGYNKKDFKIIEDAPEKAWVDLKTAKSPKPVKDENVTTARKARVWLENVVEEGNRYTMNFEWNTFEREGHIISVFKENGHIKFYDPQIGEIFKGKEVDAYMRQIGYKKIYKGRKIKTPISILRIDNLAFNTHLVNDLLE